MRTICFLSLFFIFSICSAQINDTLNISAGYAVDSASVWKKEAIASKQFTPFAHDNTANIGYNKNAAIWCLFHFKNKQNTTLNKWLCLNNIHLDSITFYDKGIEKLLGDRTTNSSSFIESPAFEISLKPYEQKSLLVRVKKGISFFEFTYSIENESYLIQKSNMKIATVSFLLGIIFLLIIFNTFLFYTGKKKLYLYYILYSLLTSVYVMVSTGYAKHLLMPNFILFSEVRIYSACFWLISVTTFLSHYLDLKRLQPIKHKAINIFNGINILMILITIVLLLLHRLDNLKPFFILGYINFIIVILLIITATLFSFKVNKNTAIYALFAFVPEMIWGLVVMLKSMKVISQSLDEDSLVLISLYEVFLFGYVLAKDYIETFRKNNELIREIIAEKERSLQAVTQTQIRERRNIANVIHDNFGSQIAYILQLLQLKNTDLANQSIKELADDIREISHNILPKSLDEGALVSSLRSRIAIWNTALGHTRIELSTYDFEDKINEAWVHDIYLISVEIINNALRHGKAAFISIELFEYPESWVFQYTDDGKGFNTQLIPKGFGLENIEKRVDYYKGIFEINSSEDEGTVIQISIPKKS